MEQDQWSMDLATLMRIDRILQDINICHVTTDLVLLRLNLKALRNETIPHLNDKEKEQEIEIWETVVECELGFTVDNDFYMQDDLMNILDDYELFLKQKLMDHQLLMKKGMTHIQTLRS